LNGQKRGSFVPLYLRGSIPDNKAMEATMNNIAGMIRGKTAAYVGELASMSHEEFEEIVDRHGGRYTDGEKDNIAVLIVGSKGWPIGPDAMLPESLIQQLSMQFDNRRKPTAVILSERQFIDGLGLEERREATDRLYTVGTLAELLKVTRQRIVFWVQAGLIRPVRREHEVSYFDFRQVSAAQTLVELHRASVPFNQLRKSLEQLKKWLPEAAQPLEQLTVVEEHGKLLVRVGEEDLAATDGQFHFDFTGEPPPLPLASPFKRVVRSAAQWRDLAVEQQANGLYAEAAESFREALLLAGPDPEICFDLAHTLAAMGKKEEAAERYRQTVELEPKHVDAWNNLGVILSDLKDLEGAAKAFRRVLGLDPMNSRAIYNLADTLEDLGRAVEAKEHWKAYLRLDNTSEHAAYARSRLGRYCG
jgi:tetratricopeptide (TPR) repeat protein